MTQRYQSILITLLITFVLINNSQTFSQTTQTRQNLDELPLCKTDFILSQQSLDLLKLNLIAAIEEGRLDEIYELSSRLSNSLYSAIPQDINFKGIPAKLYKGVLLLSKSTKYKTTKVVELFFLTAKLFQHTYSKQNMFIPFVYREAGDYLFQAQNYEFAIHCFRKSISENLYFSTDHKASILQRIGLCYIKLNDSTIAEKILYESIDQYHKVAEPDSTDLGLIYNNLGVLFAQKEDYSASESNYLLAIKYYSQRENKNELRISFVHNNLGNLEHSMGNFTKAISYYQQSLNIRSSLLPEKSKQLTHSFYNIGYCHFQLNNIDSALYYCQKSMICNVYDFNNLDISTNPKKLSCISTPSLIVSLTDKSQYLLKRYNSPKGISDDLNIALNSISLAKSLFMSLNSDLAAIKSKLAWVESNDRINQLCKLASLYSNKDDKSKIETLIEIDNNKNKNHEFILSYNLKNEIGNIPRLENEISQHALYRSGNIKTIGSQEFSTQDYLKYQQFTKDQSSQNTELTIDNISSIQTNLDNDDLIISFGLIDHICIIHFISQHQVIAESIDINNLESLISNHNNRIQRIEDPTYTGTKIFDDLLKNFYPIIEPYSNLIIIPDGFLFDLPFETITVINRDGSPKFLVSKHNISYGFSLKSVSNKFKEILNPEFYYVGFSPFGYLNQSSDHETSLVSNYEKNSLLKYADNEISNAIETFRNNGYRSVGFYGCEATPIQLKTSGTNANIIHIATHNYLDPDNPWMSKVKFSADSLFESGDIYLQYIYHLNISTNLLILNACSTSKGKLFTGEGHISVARAFACNRIDNLIMTRWSIIDKTTSNFMKAFYKSYTNNNNPSKSLSEVKRQFINSPFSHP
ncbi:MAG: CHAT domain-containing protein, partial [Bacteroidetes bacterium]|nr:CHAT domain-containing protein [Bacteroidota bacterium]